MNLGMVLVKVCLALAEIVTLLHSVLWFGVVTFFRAWKIELHSRSHASNPIPFHGVKAKEEPRNGTSRNEMDDLKLESRPPSIVAELERIRA